MKKIFFKSLSFVGLLIHVFSLQAADRYWVHQALYQNFFSTAGYLSDWQLIEDDGTGGFTLSGSSTGMLTMDDAAGGFANRLFNKNGAAARLLPFDAVNGRVELLVKSITGGNQRIFLQAQEFTGSGAYLGQVNILPARSATGFFSVNFSSITWDPATVQVRFIIGGENYSGQQGTVEFGYFSYSNTNGNWNNPANWSSVSGGPGGASVPGASDNAIFNGAGNASGSCLLDTNGNIYSLQISSGYSGDFDLQNNPMTIGAGGATIAGGGIKGGTQNVQINGNVVISGGAFTSPSGNTYVTGDVSITGAVLNFGTGAVVLNGSTDQQFLASVITTFNNVTVDKIAGAVNFSSDILISNTLTLNQGILNMNGNTMRLGTSAANAGSLAVVNGKINGNFARWINSTNTGNISFPLGNASATAGLTINIVSPPSVGGVVTASYLDAPPSFNPVNFPDGGTTILRESAANWKVQTSGVSGGNYTLAVSSDHLGTISALADLHLTLAGGVVGTQQLATGTVTVPILNRSGLTAANLAQTFFASVSTVILPITWTSFTIARQGETYEWNWSLGIEENVAYYTPQYSLNGADFTDAGSVTALNSSHSYDFTAPLTEDGTIFFRIKEVDMDGRLNYSIIKTLAGGSLARFSIYPNPATSELHIVWPYPDANSVSTTIVNNLGVIVRQQMNTFQSVINIPLSMLSPGTYFVYCTDNKLHQSIALPMLKIPG